MKVEALSASDQISNLKHSSICAAAIVASVFSYSSLAFTILIMLWPYSAVDELGQRVIGFFVGIIMRTRGGRLRFGGWGLNNPLLFC